MDRHRLEFLFCFHHENICRILLNSRSGIYDLPSVEKQDQESTHSPNCCSSIALLYFHHKCIRRTPTLYFFRKFNIESAFETAKVYQDYHLEESSSGSSYRLLEFDNPIATYLLNIPGAINVTFFRPYIWEINSAAMALSALESLFVLGLFLLVLRRGGFKTNYRILKSDLVLMGLLIFSLLMAYIVGFATYNFGTLVRYKIPCLMSLLVILCVLYDRLTEIKLSRRRL